MIRKLLAAAAILAAALIQAPVQAADPPARAETAAPAAPAAAPAPAAASPAAVEATGEATVVVFNRSVAVFRAHFLGVSPADRARRAERAIGEILEKGGPGKVTTGKEGQRVGVFIDGELAFVLVAADADRLRAETLEAATATTTAALANAIAETREARDQSLIIKALVRAGIATLVYAVLAWVTLRTRSWLSTKLADALHRTTARVRLAGEHFLSGGRLLSLARWSVQATAVVLLLVMADRWVTYVLLQFPFTRPWGEQADQFVWGIVVLVGGNILRAIPDLLIAVVIFLLARGFIGLFRPTFDRIEAGVAGSTWLDMDTARPTRRLFSVAVWLFAIVMAYPYLPGSNSEAFKGMSVLVGLMVTMGGSSLFGQAASGLILMYSRTVRVGEYVRINDQEGTVTELGTFTTKIRTGLGEEVTVPNTVVLNTVTKNYSRVVKGRGYVVDTTVTIGYDTPWRQVEAMLKEAAKRTEGVLPDPEPRVFQTGLSDFYPEYRLVCQAVPTEPRPRAVVLSNLHANIQDVFNEHGVQIMSPHYLGDPADAKVVPKAKWYAKPAVPPAGSASDS
ncbi:MAG: mechanosensitive ion channel family protein [Betaproteobacteria bacterium]|nr:mechanosensitive ion channel family protein [Betaproteobacteria bacterium]PWB60981.1 MAG: mechanosensitive ion channel protein MscS [Betaproteobacteria bacterium]